MISRKALAHIAALAGQFPAVLILGPRQCGKTTLAKHFVQGTYLDLERPSDRQVLEADPEGALRRLPYPLILDEVQTMPGIFPVLRALIDEERKRPGRFYLLGSVNPALVRASSESLAGRVGLAELTPLLCAETTGHPLDLETHWLRGGFPDACLEPSGIRRALWQENYLRMVVERDLAGLSLKAGPHELQRLLGMLAHLHGGLLNSSELGRAMGLNYHTISSYLDLFEGHYLIRRLRPWHGNLGKRLTKTPKVFLRDSGLLHHLLGVREQEDLLRSPRRGASWEGFAIEQIVARESLAEPGANYWFYRTHAGAEIDLVVDRGSRRTGYEFKCATIARPADASGLKAGLADGVIHSGRIVYLGDRAFPLAEGIDAVPAANLLVW